MKGVTILQRHTISFLLSFLTLLAGACLVLSAVQLYYEMPMNVSITGQASLALYVNDTPWVNGTSVSWGSVSPGDTSMKNLSIQNTGNTALQLSLASSGLPSDWGLTYSENGTIIQPDAWVNGTITLTVSSQALVADYYWLTYITAT